MKILITTPGAGIGRRVLWELLAPEFDVRVIARDPAKLPEEIREQAEVVQGSTSDANTLRRALEGVDACAFWLNVGTICRYALVQIPKPCSYEDRLDMRSPW